MTISGFIAYAIQTWKNKPDTSTPLSAARLAHIEAGIKANSDAITKLAAAVINQQANDVNKIPSSALMYSVNDKVDSVISDLGDCHKLKNKRLIPGGADLNNYKTPGTYLVNSADLSTIKNKPTGWTTTGGIITIEDWADPAVVTMTVKTYFGGLYWRNYQNTWGDWNSGKVTG